MGIRVKIFLAFMLVIASGLALVAVRSFYIGIMIDTLNEQNQVVRSASDFIQKAQFGGDDDGAMKIELMGYINEIGEKGQKVTDTGVDADRVAAVVAVLVVALTLAVATVVSLWFGKKIHFYENILDKIPLPLSITDMNMKVTFLNKPVEDMLNIKRADAMGKYCGDVWKAAICNTPSCGIECLRRDQKSTIFGAGGATFKVEPAYLTDTKQRNSGHIEVVQNISDMMTIQKEQSDLIVTVKDANEKFSAASSELNSETRTNADTAAQAASLFGIIKEHAGKSSSQMTELLKAVTEIREANNAVVNVTNAINDIARRTNILALNASVEAARGGEQGRSFAVVAEEIRTLAIQSSAQVRDTEELIEDSIQKAELGAQIARATAESLEEIMDDINKSSSYINEIARATEMQSGAINDLHMSVERISVMLGEK
ncbi:MAG: methyl-accepting chemotaxis protein [Oscillospiraceae bacterium]|nr:methyl-accepting chemotaxis protein [Oscillospiraceae bacterium]